MRWEGLRAIIHIAQASAYHCKEETHYLAVIFSLCFRLESFQYSKPYEAVYISFHVLETHTPEPSQTDILPEKLRNNANISQTLITR